MMCLYTRIHDLIKHVYNMGLTINLLNQIKAHLNAKKESSIWSR